MKIAFIDCPSGVAGDMLLGALIDAGASVEQIRRDLELLRVTGWALETTNVHRAGIRATKVDVTVSDRGSNRNYAEIKRVLEAAALPERVARRSLATFKILAEAEAAVHGVEVDEVHFHEVGGMDALIDIVGCCSAVEALKLESIIASPLPSGAGTVRTEHGVLPVPAPAVVEILRGVPIYGAGTHELVTPTGAALLVANCDSFGSIPSMEIDSIGYGAGDRDSDEANVTRVLVGESVSADEPPTHLLIETNVDDMSPELIPYALERLLASGADDAWVASITMKKGRPAFTVSALTTESNKDAVLDALFRETTTFGARIQRVGKAALTREWVEVEVAGLPVRVKLAKRAGEVVTAAPEHDDAVKVAKATGMSLKNVYAEAIKAYDRVRSS
ncbi:MAG: pyridinium-3,5-bisthiocarboxylic acid mononucleotide nickel chelatase [Actinomycetota bacterium]|jgi:uncharacterized protein (TIGR00299 family) protein|nr:pyridinium-3,5-bisthiocarboxylic acid mononucleotide nickel chelatase [Actinomycetota bacterium]